MAVLAGGGRCVAVSSSSRTRTVTSSRPVRRWRIGRYLGAPSAARVQTGYRPGPDGLCRRRAKRPQPLASPPSPARSHPGTDRVQTRLSLGAPRTLGVRESGGGVGGTASRACHSLKAVSVGSTMAAKAHNAGQALAPPGTVSMTGPGPVLSVEDRPSPPSSSVGLISRGLFERSPGLSQPPRALPLPLLVRSARGHLERAPSTPEARAPHSQRRRLPHSSFGHSSRPSCDRPSAPTALSVRVAPAVGGAVQGVGGAWIGRWSHAVHPLRAPTRSLTGLARCFCRSLNWVAPLCGTSPPR